MVTKMDLNKEIEILKNTGWTSVKLQRTNLWNWQNFPDDEGWGELANFNHICRWCDRYVGEGKWMGSIYPHKEFVFKNKKDLTLFLLRWNDYV